MRLGLPILAVLIATSARADGPPPSACAPTESYEVCGLIVEMLNAEKDLIHAQALRQREADYWIKYVVGVDQKERALAEFWMQYMAGIELQRQQAAKDAALHAARAAEAAARR